MSVDLQKNVYLFVHGRMDLKQKAIDLLVEKGFNNQKIIMATPNKVGRVGDYMAMLWRPPNPNHIKVQKIVEIKNVEPEGMIGLWKGVQAEDLFTIPLS